MKGILRFFPEIWKKNIGFFDTGLIPIFGNFGESENLVFGVHIFTHGNGAVLFIVLTEYIRDSSVATIDITAKYLTGWLGQSIHKKGEEKLRLILENLTYDDLEEFASVGRHFEDDSIFICPNCKAQYAMRVLTITKDGKTECQNCLSSFDSVELDVARGAASYDS